MLEKVLNRIKGLRRQTEDSLKDALGLAVQLEDRSVLLEWLRWIRKEATLLKSAEGLEIVKKTYFIAGQRGDFDSYCIALEWYRSPDKRFYLPRRAVLKTLVDDLQDLFDGKLDFLGVSLPPRVGKSTLCIFFMTFVMGNRPAVANVMSGHSDKLTDGF
jgi:hypothetical protein